MITIADRAALPTCDTSIPDNAPANPVFHALHTSPTRMGQVAAAADPRHLVLSHLTPVTEPNIDAIEDIIRAQGHRRRRSRGGVDSAGKNPPREGRG